MRSNVYDAVEIRHGYSKEHRPDLKQVVVTLITSQASALPLWLEVLDGNSSDKESFPADHPGLLPSTARGITALVCDG